MFKIRIIRNPRIRIVLKWEVQIKQIAQMKQFV
jgi:hypothetical protein